MSQSIPYYKTLYKSQVKKIFSALHPPGDIDIDAGVSRMETVARHARRLAQQGQGDVARRTCYFLVQECVSFCED